MKKKMMLLAVLLIAVSASACMYPATTDSVTSSSSNKCSAGSCYIRSAGVCCPNGYLYYGGAGTGCRSSLSSCQNASGGKCWYETSCIQ